MLKACWDCVAGSRVLNNGGANEGSYGTQLNGHSQGAPIRPEEKNMFRLPRAINAGDSINVIGSLNNSSYTINLVTGNSAPDYNNIACQLEVNSHKCNVSIIVDGELEFIDTSSMPKDDSISIQFKFRQENEEPPELLVSAHGSHVARMYLNTKHELNNINFLQFIGDVSIKGLEFQFA